VPEIESAHLGKVRLAVPASKPRLEVDRKLRDQLTPILGAGCAVLLFPTMRRPTPQQVAVMIAFDIRTDARRPASINATTSASTMS
jgi:hypothetical protein